MAYRPNQAAECLFGGVGVASMRRQICLFRSQSPSRGDDCMAANSQPPRYRAVVVDASEPMLTTCPACRNNCGSAACARPHDTQQI